MRLLSTAIAVALAMVGLTATRSAAAEHGVKVGPFVFSKLAEQLPAGAVYATFQERFFGCKTRETLKGDGILKVESIGSFGPIFAREITIIDQLRTNKSENLFDSDIYEDNAAYEVAGLIHSMDMVFCADYAPDPATNIGVQGTGIVSIQWQIYSRDKSSVVATIETTGKYQQLKLASRAQIVALVAQGAFAENVK